MHSRCPHCGGEIDTPNPFLPLPFPSGTNPFAGPNTPAPETNIPQPGTNMCSISRPLGLYIPSGQTMEWPCSVHGSHTLRG